MAGRSTPVVAILCCCAAASLIAGAPQQSPATAAPTGAPRVEQFAGVWDYNATESLDAATGRPEQDPKTGAAKAAAAQRQAAQPTPPRDPDPVTGAPPQATSAAAGTNGRPPDEAAVQNYRSMLTAWSRSAARDLLEVPETLTITVAADEVTFVDDLERSRTYPTNGRKTKYQLGSAIYDAKTYWDGPRLKKEIQSVGRFQMSETYFLSEDGQRLFVVVRIGDPSKTLAKNAPVVGVNRVYDRVR
jgi:hypothetical protein